MLTSLVTRVKNIGRPVTREGVDDPIGGTAHEHTDTLFPRRLIHPRQPVKRERLIPNRKQLELVARAKTAEITVSADIAFNAVHHRHALSACPLVTLRLIIAGADIHKLARKLGLGVFQLMPPHIGVRVNTLVDLLVKITAHLVKASSEHPARKTRHRLSFHFLNLLFFSFHYTGKA